MTPKKKPLSRKPSFKKSKKNGSVEYIIERKVAGKLVYLADIFQETPAGFFYKDETGMGATTLELNAKRNSIIVEPIKITASSKAYKHNALYVGSPTKYHTQKAPSKLKIKKYTSDSSIQHKKIVVVADSLPKVVDAIGSDVFKDYFLLVDEIDSFQLDSTYRKSMELVLDIYKNFPQSSRAMLSATKIDFTDPILCKEPVTSVRYDNPKSRTIDVMTTDSFNLHGVIIDHIKYLQATYPDDKIFVAYNTVKGSLDLCEHLIKEKIAAEKEVRILCSQASASIAEKYYQELDSEELPAMINFFTSAYFTGFDLSEEYHLISVSSNRRPSLALSDRRLKQIAGRSRSGLISETVIHDYSILSNQEETTKEKLLEASNNQADALTCSKKHYSRSPVLKQILESFTSKVLGFLEEKRLRFIREDNDGKIVCSYLNLDAFLESQRVRKELYQSNDALTKQLTLSGNTVKQTLVHSDTSVEKTVLSLADRNKQIETAIGIIRRSTKASELAIHLKHANLTSLEKSILSEYHKIYNYVDKEPMLKLIEDGLLDKKDTRKFKTLMQSAEFHVRSSGDMVVDLMDRHFPIQPGGKSLNKEKLSSHQIKVRMEMLLSQIGAPTSALEEVSAVRLLKSLRKVYKKSENGKIVYIVNGSNPLKIPVVKQRMRVNAEDIFAAYFQY